MKANEKQKPYVNEKPKPEDMVVTPERALMIKKALIKQWEDQFGVKVISWTEEHSKPAATA